MKPEVNRKKEIKLPSKFISGDFVSFLSFLLPLDETEKIEKRRSIKGEGSLQELASDYQLLILHSIDLEDILRLLEEKGCADIRKEENYIQYHTQDIVLLMEEIRARIVS
jgi:hypothetical protein